MNHYTQYQLTPYIIIKTYQLEQFLIKVLNKKAEFHHLFTN